MHVQSVTVSRSLLSVVFILSSEIQGFVIYQNNTDSQLKALGPALNYCIRIISIIYLKIFNPFHAMCEISHLEVLVLLVWICLVFERSGKEMCPDISQQLK